MVWAAREWLLVHLGGYGHARDRGHTMVGGARTGDRHGNLYDRAFLK